MYERTVFSATEMDPFASILACKRNLLGVSLSSNINLDQPTQSPFSDVGPNALCTPSVHRIMFAGTLVRECRNAPPTPTAVHFLLLGWVGGNFNN